MNFLVDECCSIRMVNYLREAGHDIYYVVEEMQGATDTQLLEKASRKGRDIDN